MKPHTQQPILRRMRLTPAERRAMTSAVLARTTGSACQRALTLIGGQPDSPIDNQTTTLIEGHLEQCAACQAVAQTLAETRAVLATLAEIEPAADFATGVVAATSGRRAVSRGVPWVWLVERWAWVETCREWAGSTWERVLARPRLSLEAAYLATVLLVIVVGNPALVANAIGGRTNGIVAGETTSSAGAGARQQGAIWQRATSAVPAYVERAMREIESRQASASKGWAWLVDRTSHWAASAWDWLRGLFGWVEAQTVPPAPTEPANPPVRGSQ
ncbi:MAG: hypothetical protein NTV05_09625 [Acidobacteria bacterium]|nr:hypothetical protein [Acidobacteriota bacterium]